MFKLVRRSFQVLKESVELHSLLKITYLCMVVRKLQFNYDWVIVGTHNIDNWNDGCNLPSVRSAAIEIRSGKLDWSGILISAPRSMERKCCVGIVEITNTNIVDGF